MSWISGHPYLKYFDKDYFRGGLSQPIKYGWPVIHDSALELAFSSLDFFMFRLIVGLWEEDNRLLGFLDVCRFDDRAGSSGQCHGSVIRTWSTLKKITLEGVCHSSQPIKYGGWPVIHDSALELAFSSLDFFMFRLIVGLWEEDNRLLGFLDVCRSDDRAGSSTGNSILFSTLVSTTGGCG
jgi:hypothetical protein